MVLGQIPILRFCPQILKGWICNTHKIPISVSINLHHRFLKWASAPPPWFTETSLALQKNPGGWGQFKKLPPGWVLEIV